MNQIPVTKAFLPPLEEYTAQVQRAYHNGWLTNRGVLVKELELKLAAYLNLSESRILCMNNGTVPLQIAIKLLGGGGEIITTPFSYVATTSAIVWEGCTPVFVDIHPAYLTIDTSKIEAAITEKTTCILATHVYGNPCDIEEIERIARKYRLKVIYDAAHCFGVQYKGKSIFEYGDISTCSFHATKLFHTGEGGAIFCKDPDLYNKVYYSHNFGHDGPMSFQGIGINGKMSELQAAMGLSVLPYVDEIIHARREIVEIYQHLLKHQDIRFVDIMEHTIWNYNYFPIILSNEIMLVKVEKALLDRGIFPRRYFYPSLHQLPYVKSVHLPVVEATASLVLCLPLYKELDHMDVEMICGIILNAIN
jgi:dTDP-4-amino-4,6-dideoxygalactose transaminase